MTCCSHVLLSCNVLLCVCCTGSSYDENSWKVNGMRQYSAKQSLCTPSAVVMSQETLTVPQRSDTRKALHCCHQCRKCFASHGSLYNHTKTLSSMYECTECGKCCHNSHVLAVHRQSHSGQTFECRVCNKRFTTLGNLVVHGRIHSEDKPYKCPMCDEAFSESGLRNTHMEVHKSRIHSCTHCSEQFRWSYQLRRHLLASHDGGSWFTCNICEKKFAYRGHLRKHVCRHDRVKP